MAFSGASDPYADLIPKDKKKAAALAAGDPYADLIPKNKRKSGAQTGDPYADLIPKETGAGGGHGFIEESELAEIFDAGGRVVGKLRKGEVATAYNEMVRAAAAAGIQLRPTSAGDTYRGPNVYSDPSVRQKVEAGYAAPPGKSPHNLGEAVDFLESPGVKEWLAKNAGRFGFRLGGSKYGLHVEWVGLPKVPGLGPELQPSAGFAGYAGTPQAAVPGRGLIELLKQATGVHEAYETPEKLRIQALQRDLRDLRKMLESAQRVYATTPAEIQKILKEVSDMARRRDQLERELKAEYGDRWRTAPDLKFRYREWERLGRELSDRLERDRPLTLRNIPNLTFRMQATKERMDRLQAEIRTKEKELADITARIPGRARANDAISGALKLRPAHANEIRRAVELFAPIDEKKLPADPQQAADIVRGRWAEIPKRVAALEALSKQVGEDSPARDVLRKLIEQGRREQDRMASLLQTTYKSTRAPGGVLVRKPNTKTFAEIIASSADPQAAADNLRRIISRDIAPGLDPKNPQTYEEVYHTYAHRRPFRTVEGRDVLHELPVLDEEMRLRLLRRKGDERPPQEYVDADWEIEGDYDGHVAVGRVLIGLTTKGASEVVRRILPSKGVEQADYSLGRAVMNLYSGMESLIAGIVGFIETGAGARRESPISDFIMEHAREIGSKDDTFLDVLLKAAGSMLPMLATGGMAAGATGSLLRGTALMNSARGVKIAKGLASLTGAGSAALLEAGAEAEHVRRGMLQAGASYDEAQRGAIQSFLANLAVLWVTNKLGIFSEKAGSLRKVLLSSSMEGLQEAIQQMISNEATGAPLLDGVLEAAGVGAILGSGASVVESARQRAEWTKRDQENLEEIAAAARDAYARYKEIEAEKKARPEPAPGESWQELTARGHTMTQEEYVRLASEKARLERADKRLPDAEMTGAAAMFAHRKLVAQALEEGKRVPDNVLEEFLSSGGTLPKTGLHPEIAAKYAQARTGSRVAAGKEEIIDRVFAPADAHAYRQLQTALEKAPSVDARNRIADLMGKLEQKLAPEDLRQLVGEEEFARRSVSGAPAKGKAGRLVDVAAGTARSQPQARKVAVGEAIPGPVGRATRPRSVIEPGKKFEARYRVVELDDLVPSNLDDFTTNPAFPAELQPRDRDRMALRQQVETIAREFNVDQALEDIPRLSAGTPTIAADGTVISGNGRTMAFRRVRSARPEVWAEYKRQLAERADEFGIDPSELAGMRDPVLVRELGPGEDVRFAAEDANESEAAEMSAFERSLADAKKLDPVAVESMFVPASGGIEAALRSRQNDRLVQSFVSALPMNQRSKMMDAEGGLSREGMERLEDALFAYVYGEQKSGRLHEMAVESKDERLSNLIRALKASLPAVARTESLVKQGERDASLSIVGDVVAAAEVLNRLRIQKTPVEMYVRQLSLEEKRELTPTQETLLVLFDANKRGYRALAEVFDEYSRLVWESAHTDQGAMFDLGPPDKHTLLRAAINEVGARFDEALQVREEVDEYRERLLEEFDPEKVEHVPDTWDLSLDLVAGDRIRWTEPVFGGSFKRPKFLGERTVEGLVIRESYGADRARHSFSIRVDQSSGFDALPAGKVVVRRGKTLYGNGAEVLDWADKDLYNAVREEKHERGQSAKSRARGIVREENLWYNEQADQIQSEGALAPPETKATGADAERVQHLSDVGSAETAPGAAAAPEGPSLLDSRLRQQFDEALELREEGGVYTAAGWPFNFPKMRVMTSGLALKADPDYRQAKAGDIDAAIRLVDRLARPDRARELAAAYPGAVLVPVIAVEAAGKNHMPRELAEYIAARTGMEVTEDIVQVNRVHRTGKEAIYRLAFRPKFDGEVVAGQEYVLIDDVATMGGTFAELAHYIASRGGKVVGAMTLASGGKGSTNIAPSEAQLRALTAKFGREELVQFLQEQGINGGQPEQLTRSEASAILNHESLDALRDRIAQARIEARRREGAEVFRAEVRQAEDESTVEAEPGRPLLDSDLRQLAMFGGPEPINKAVDITPKEFRQPPQNSLFGTLPNGEPVYIKKGPTPGAPGHLVLPGMEHLTQFVPEVAPKEERSKGSEEQRHFMEILDNRFGEDVVSECLQAYTTRDGVNFDQVENAITIYARTRQREARESARQREARESARQREAREAGREGVDPGRRGGREDEAEILVIAESIDRSILARGTAELHGRRVSDPGELARLLQVVRGSIEGEIFEVLRVIYVNDQDVVVGSDAWSSRLPSASSFQIQGMDPEETVEWLHRRMRAVGGSGFWLVHNHPSGVSMPSNADLTLTESVAEWLPGFRGHVIINSGNYAHIRVNEQGEAEFAVFGMPDVTDPLYAVPQPKAGEWLGFNIKNPSQLVIYSQAVLKSSGYLLTVHDAKGGVQAIYEVPLAFFDRDVPAIVRRLKALAAPMGGRDVSIAALSIPLRHRRILRELSFDPIVFDVVDGYGYSQAAENKRQGLVGPPRLPPPPGVLIEEETSSYATDIFQNIDPFVVYLARVAAEVGAATATKSKAVMMKAILDRLRTDGSAERAGPYLKAVVEQALRVSLRTSVPNADVILDAPERGRDATRPGKDPVRTWNSFFDSLEAASWARDMLESAYGGTVDLKRTHLDIEENLDRVGRVAGRVAMTVRHGWHDEFGNKLTHGLEEIKSGMEADGIPYAHWQKYRRSLRALEIFGRLPHAAQGTYIQRYLEAIETIETFRNLYDADKVKVWDDAFDLYTWHWHLEWERTGLRPQGWAAELRAENQYYYPMHPMPDPDSVMMRELNPSKLASPLAENVRAIGLEEKMDGFTAMAWETERVIRAGAINRAVAPFAEAAAANPLMAGVVEDVTERQIGARKKAETREAGSASDSLEDALREALDQVDQMVAAMQRPLEEGVDPIVTLFHNGEPRQYKLDPLLWAAIRGQAPEVVNELVNLLKIPAKLFRGGTTKYNPNFFLLNNPILDITHSMVVHGLNPLLWPKGLFIASRGMRLQVYRQWLMANGQFDQSGVRDFVDREWLYDPTARDALETFIDKALQTRGVKPIANVFLGIFNVLGRGGQIMEEATRLTMFTQRLRHYRSQGIEETRAMEMAAQDAAELMNFGRVGKAGRSLWGRMTPFFNISAQVLRSAKLGLKRSPAAFITRGFLLITVPKILEYLAYGDDEEYQRLPNYIRFGGYVFRINGQWYCLRFPYELGAMFAATPQLALDIEAGKLTEREALSKGARIAGESVRPNLVPQAAQILAAQQLFSESGAVVDVSFGRVMGYPVPEGVDGDLYRYSVLQAGLIFGALGRQGARTAGYGLGLETSIPSPLGRFHPSPMPITYDVLIEPRNREILRAFGVQLYPPKRWKSELSKEDFEQRVREQARAIDEGVASLVMSEGWRKMSRQERAEALEKIVDDARDDVRRERLKMDKLSGESVVKKVMERAGVKE